jgi:steroid 5-alpha reductase family enzyme
MTSAWSIATLVGDAWAVTAGVQLVLWMIQQRTRNAGIVDVGWALSFALVVALFASRAAAPRAPPRRAATPISAPAGPTNLIVVDRQK